MSSIYRANKRAGELAHKHPIKLFSSVGLIVTIGFWSNLMDPFNAPKSWLLLLGSAWLFGWIIFQIGKRWVNSTLKQSLIVAFTYLMGLSFAWFATDNKYTGLFGEYQRRTGFLPYASLIVLFLAGAYLVTIKNFTVVEYFALATGLIAGSYGLVQHLKLDPINWNNPYNSILSTLGNPDFAAATLAILAVISFGIAIQKR
jgi:uncharacterized membrane protein